MGDRELKTAVKTPLVVSVPEIRYVHLSTAEDKVVVLACDGIWDVLSDQVRLHFFATICYYFNAYVLRMLFPYCNSPLVTKTLTTLQPILRRVPVR